MSTNIYFVVINESDGNEREKQLTEINDGSQTIFDWSLWTQNFKKWGFGRGESKKSDGVEVTIPGTPMAVIANIFKYNYVHLQAINKEDNNQHSETPDKS